jgi:hypothetical protein
MSFDLSHLAGKELVWLLDLTFAGQVFRLSRDFTVYTDEDGESSQYHPGLEWGGTLEDQIDLLSDAPSPNQVALTLHLGTLIDVPEAVAAGHDLAASTGKLYLWARGTTERLLLVDGRTLDPQYGAKEEPVTLTLEEAPFDDLALIPDPLAKVDSTTWPNAAEGVEDEFYPIIIGQPGATSPKAYGSPALAVNHSSPNFWFVIAGHPLTGSGTVSWFNETQQLSGTDTPATVSDGRGRDVAQINVNHGSVDIEDEWWVIWSSSDVTGLADHDGTAIRGAGSLLRWMLEQTSVRWDRGRIAAIVEPLNLFQIDCAIVPAPGRRFSPLDWVHEHLLPILPISARQGEHGLYYSLFRYDATATDAITEINVDRLDASRDGAVVYSAADQIANEIRLSYRSNAKENKPSAVYVLTGDDSTLAGDDAAVSNAPCRVSRTRFGLRTLEAKTEVIYDSSTAGRICSWLSHAYALPSRTFAYTARQDFGYLEPGDVVTLTDSEIHLSQLVCLVDSVTWTEDGSVGLVLRAIDNPARETFTESTG